eukprot:2097015-Pyramimonas_sp.AAC.1
MPHAEFGGSCCLEASAPGTADASATHAPRMLDRALCVARFHEDQRLRVVVHCAAIHLRRVARSHSCMNLATVSIASLSPRHLVGC